MGHDRLVVEIAAGAALPFGTFSGRFKEDDPGTRPILGSAGSGYGFSGRLSYRVHSLFAASVVYLESIHEASPTHYDDTPVGRIGHGYIAPTSKSNTITVEGDWISSLFLVEGVFKARIKAPSLSIRAGVGYQNVGTGSYKSETVGTQLVLSGSPPYATEGFTSSTTQPAMRSSGSVYALGVRLGYPLGRQVHVVASLDLVVGKVRFKGTQMYRFDGATQNDADEHYEIESPVDRPNGTTRLLMQVGLAVGLFGSDPGITP